MFEEGMSYQDIVDETGLRFNQVKHAIYEARKKQGKKADPGSKRKEKTGFEERKPRVFKDDDIYTIVSSSKTHDHTVKISENALRQLKKYYCLEKLTINQLCREMRLPRRDFYLIKTAFGVTKDDTPYIDEDLINETEDDLVIDSLQEKKRLYFVKLQQGEIEQLRKENNEYRKQEYFLNHINDIVAEHMTGFAKKYNGPGNIKGPDLSKLSYLLEVPIVDLHVGKLGWGPEVGDSYDYKIARQRYMNTVDDVYSRSEKLNIDKILLPIGNDYFHYDNVAVETTAGTQQDTDTRWQQLYGVGYEMLVRTVDKFALLGPVEVVHVPGNHDWMASWHAMMYLNAWYRNSDRVNVNTDPKSRKYFEYGKVLIGYTHGDKEKKRIFGNMQVEQPQAWGRSLYREWHTGHLHSEQVKEEHGIIVRALSSVTGPDSWHFTHGYVGALAKHQTFIWHKERGLFDIMQTNI